jgi:hypothetical protein
MSGGRRSAGSRAFKKGKPMDGLMIQVEDAAVEGWFVVISTKTNLV